MLQFLKKLLRRSERDAALELGSNDYAAKLNQYLCDGKISPEECEELHRIATSYGLMPNELLPLQRRACRFLFEKLSADGVLTEEEFYALERVSSSFGFSMPDVGCDQQRIKQLYTLPAIEAGNIPYLAGQEDLPQFGIFLDQNELMAWMAAAHYKKHSLKSVVVGGRSSGVSVRIMRGVTVSNRKYDVEREKQDVVDTLDCGMFWISNKRVGFNGTRKSFVIKLNDIYSADISGTAVVLRKKNRETPFILDVVSEDWDIGTAMLRQLLRK